MQSVDTEDTGVYCPTLMRACHVQYRGSTIPSTAVFEFYLSEILPDEWEWTGWRYIDESYGVCYEVLVDLKEEVEIIDSVFDIPEDTDCQCRLIGLVRYAVDTASFLRDSLCAAAVWVDEQEGVQWFGTLHERYRDSHPILVAIISRHIAPSQSQQPALLRGDYSSGEDDSSAMFPFELDDFVDGAFEQIGLDGVEFVTLSDVCSSPLAGLLD